MPDPRNTGDGLSRVEDPTHVWVAYQSDWSEMAVFLDELPCRRHAEPNVMSVGRVPIGVDIREHLRLRPPTTGAPSGPPGTSGWNRTFVLSRLMGAVKTEREPVAWDSVEAFVRSSRAARLADHVRHGAPMVVGYSPGFASEGDLVIALSASGPRSVLPLGAGVAIMGRVSVSPGAAADAQLRALLTMLRPQLFVMDGTGVGLPTYQRIHHGSVSPASVADGLRATLVVSCGLAEKIDLDDAGHQIAKDRAVDLLRMLVDDHAFTMPEDERFVACLDGLLTQLDDGTVDEWGRRRRRYACPDPGLLEAILMATLGAAEPAVTKARPAS